LTKETYWSYRDGKYLSRFNIYFELYKFRRIYNIFKLKKIIWELYD
jgi:hypothetical protein